MCLGYDGNVYNVSHKHGWADIRHEMDVTAFNQQQLLNCRANIFVQDSKQAEIIHTAFVQISKHRPQARHRVNYAIYDGSDEDGTIRYKVVDPNEAPEDSRALLHTQVIHPSPTGWPHQIKWRKSGRVFTNGTGVGFVRKPFAGPDYREERP